MAMAAAPRWQLTPNGVHSARARNVQRLDGLWAEATHEKTEDDGAQNVLTDNIDETFVSGKVASPQEPVSLEIDLGAGGAYVDHIKLMPHQVPTPAPAHHRIWLDDKLVAELQAEVKHHQALPPVPVNMSGSKLRVETLQSAGWVAWSHVHVYGERQGSQQQQ